MLAAFDFMGSNGNGTAKRRVLEPEVLPPWSEPYLPPPWVYVEPPRPRIGLNLILFALTVLTTLSVGAHLAYTYAHNLPPYDVEFNPFAVLLQDPTQLLLGLPFSFTLLGILLAHELGHYVMCRYYGIAASYPYFIPAPTIIGTMGAFIRIRSPIVNRKALFDVGIAGPLVGFLFAVPALAVAIAYSKIIPGSEDTGSIVFGNPPLVWLLTKIFHPHASPSDVFLHPVGRAAWVGLFATALNLLPVGQLDGGHIVYALASKRHRTFSRLFCLALIPMGMLFWPGWLIWALLLLFLGMRHPAVLDPGESLDGKRKALAMVALIVFLLCFTPTPFTAQ